MPEWLCQEGWPASCPPCLLPCPGCTHAGMQGDGMPALKVYHIHVALPEVANAGMYAPSEWNVAFAKTDTCSKEDKGAERRGTGGMNDVT